MCDAPAWNKTDPRNGPRMRPSDANAWFTPSTSPCRAGSARFDTSAETDGFTNANPITATDIAR